MKRARTLSAVAAVGLMASGAAFAQSYPAPWKGDFWGYIGASGGEAKFRNECSRTLTVLHFGKPDNYGHRDSMECLSIKRFRKP